MAAGFDGALKSSAPSPLAPARPAQKQPGYPSYGSPPPMIADSAVADQSNNLLAGAAGQGRSAMQGMDRAGVSRGRGQQGRSDMAESMGNVQGQLAAAKNAMGAASANSQAAQTYENTMKSERLGNNGLLEQLRHNQQLEGLAKRGWAQNTYETMRRGQLGLDSQYLDTSGLLGQLTS